MHDAYAVNVNGCLHDEASSRAGSTNQLVELDSSRKRGLICNVTVVTVQIKRAINGL